MGTCATSRRPPRIGQLSTRVAPRVSLNAASVPRTPMARISGGDRAIGGRGRTYANATRTCMYIRAPCCIISKIRKVPTVDSGLEAGHAKHWHATDLPTTQPVDVHSSFRNSSLLRPTCFSIFFSNPRQITHMHRYRCYDLARSRTLVVAVAPLLVRRYKSLSGEHAIPIVRRARR